MVLKSGVRDTDTTGGGLGTPRLDDTSRAPLPPADGLLASSRLGEGGSRGVNVSAGRRLIPFAVWNAFGRGRRLVPGLDQSRGAVRFMPI